MKPLTHIVNWGLVGALATACGSSAPVTTNKVSPSEVKTVTLSDMKNKPKPSPAVPGKNVPAIKVDTVGYPVGWKKVVVFNVDPAGAVVKDASGKTVLTVASDKVVYKGIDESSKDEVWQVDISELDKPGTYTVEVGEHKSDPFVVDTYWKVYEKAVVALVKSFYFQRTRTALTEPYAVWEGDKYLREGVSHVYDDVGWDYTFWPEKKMKWQQNPDKLWWPGEQLKKGWFDAGNFDMYIPSTGPSTQILLYAYELAPERFPDKVQNIPESGNGVPDILDECTWGLDWIMSLQQKDGGFRHSEAVREWTGQIAADEDREPRWIREVSSSATGKAVAVLAQASQLYKQFEPYKEMAAKYEQAAKLGWEWLKKHPDHVRADGKGSPQPLWDDDPNCDICTDKGARFVAAVEMWVRFRDQDALAYVKKMIEDKVTEVSDPHSITTGSWVNVSRYGLIALAFDKETPEDLRTYAKDILKRCADEEMIPQTKKDGYLVLSKPEDYYWGHNANLAEKAHMLAMVAKLTGDDSYMQAARDQWHWLMGRNPNSFAMATRVGKGVTAFYHMEWGPYSPPPPGYAIGGPNATKLHMMAPGAPAKCLIWDNEEPTRVGTPAHTLFHWRQEDIWDAGFVPEGEWSVGWWEVVETDLLYSADFVLAAIAVGE